MYEKRGVWHFGASNVSHVALSQHLLSFLLWHAVLQCLPLIAANRVASSKSDFCQQFTKRFTLQMYCSLEFIPLLFETPIQRMRSEYATLCD